jgi:peptidoglycan/LPS O-acetylase OafA/YrhL
MQDLFATSRINYVFWSIAVEWHIYFIVPLLVLAWKRFGASKTVIGALVLGFALRLAFGYTRLSRAHPQFLGMFALGMLAAYVARSSEPLYKRLRERGPWTPLAALMLSLAVAATVYWGISLSETRFHWFDLPIGIMTAASLAAASRGQRSWIHRFFSWPPLVVLGTFSYSLYLIHAPLLQVMWQYGLVPLQLRNEAMLGWLLTVGLALVGLSSYAFFRMFEAPFMRSPQRAPSAKPEPIA